MIKIPFESGIEFFRNRGQTEIGLMITICSEGVDLTIRGTEKEEIAATIKGQTCQTTVLDIAPHSGLISDQPGYYIVHQYTDR